MVDLRERVEEDRGLIKNIQLAIPGFRGYRKREDIRIADSLLRIQLADAIRDGVLKNLNQTREVLSRSLELLLINEVGSAIQITTGVEARIRHAEEGYSGISPSYRINEEQLNILYEFDLSMINLIQNMTDKSFTALNNSRENSYSLAQQKIQDVSNGMRNVSDTFSKRHEVMANLGAF
ncbi:MAG: hypothetical protein GXY48_00845 [Methanomicrobiales archaeon]|nr:hypothetical protein [Methanomicrobiales archaeon]